VQVREFETILPVAAIALGLLWVTRKTQKQFIDELIDLGLANPAHEQIPEKLFRELVKAKQFGLLTLFMGSGNWGIRWSRGTRAPADPARQGWQGRPPCNGKHVMDRLCGGLGIPHVDSSFLQRTYDAWGSPGSFVRGKNYGAVKDDPRWQAWAARLLARRDFQRWIVTEWLEHKWDPSNASNPTVATKMLNARMRSSATGWANSVAGRPYLEQERYYNSRRPRQYLHVRRIVAAIGAIQ